MVEINNLSTAYTVVACGLYFARESDLQPPPAPGTLRIARHMVILLPANALRSSQNTSVIVAQASIKHIECRIE